jgi:hypothetical protein
MKQLLTTVAVLAIASAAHADMVGVGEWQGGTPADPTPVEFCSFDNVTNGTSRYILENDTAVTDQHHYIPWQGLTMPAGSITGSRLIHLFWSEDPVDVTFKSRGAAYILSEPLAVYAGSTDVTELFESDNFDWEVDINFLYNDGDIDSIVYDDPNNRTGLTKSFGFFIQPHAFPGSEGVLNGEPWKNNYLTGSATVGNFMWDVNDNESDRFYSKRPSRAKHLLSDDVLIEDTGNIRLAFGAELPKDTVIPYDETWTFQAQITCVM